MPRRGNKRKKKRRRQRDEEQSNPVAHPSQRMQGKSKDEELVFEDPFVDEYEKEDVVKTDTKSRLEDDEEEEKNVQQQVWQPSDGLAESMQLDYDSSAYKAFHRMRVDWPCLSFDVIPDGLGQYRRKYPQTLYIAAGTQADRTDRNHIKLLKISDMHKTQHDEDSDGDDDPDNYDDDPILEEKRMSHPGGINRIRVCPQQPGIIATHGDSKVVHVWDAKAQLAALDRPPSSRIPRPEPLFSFSGHSQEGFSLDWCPTRPGRLLTGDCAGHIYLWEPAHASWDISDTSFAGHSASVEDLQWSPTEATVFASCSADRTIRIWDTRAPRDSCMLWVAAHRQDVNVINWNRKQAHLLLSGSDDGSIKVWDLRSFTSSNPAAHFRWHSHPITSVQWHPSDESVFAAACGDDSISFWDMGLEEDPDLPAEGADVSGLEVPPQLLFIHRGQNQIKEVHWHRQIPGLCISTAATGFNFLHPANLDNLQEEHFEGKFLQKEKEKETKTNGPAEMET